MRKGVLPLCSLLAAAALAACSAASRYEVLSFFFDGVPNPSAPAPLASEPERPNFVYQPPPPDPASQLKMHAPYAQRRCDACHKNQRDRSQREDGFSMRTVEDMSALRLPLAQLCISCHAPSRDPFQHAPALLGDCTRCHHPHASLNPHLLLAPTSKALCVECHDQDTLATPDLHATFGDRDCASCHDPHAAAARHLLRQGWDAAPASAPPGPPGTANDSPAKGGD